MKKTNKFLSVFLALIMVIGIIPISSISASAVETSGKCGDNLTWDFNEEVGALVINGIGPMYDYKYSEIPWKDYAYSTYSIYIGDDVSTICDLAFSEFEQVGSIEIGKNVVKIGENAFSYAGCNVYSGYIIVDIPVSVEEIGSYAFSGCPYMEVNYDGTEEQWNAITIGSGNESLFNGYINFKGITQKPSGDAGEGTRWEFDQSTGTLTISGTGEMMDFSSDFFPWIRFDNDIKNIVIKDGVTSIGDYAFNVCVFAESVTIPDSVTSIGKYAFAYCGSLKNLTIPNGVTIIDDLAFYDSGLTAVTIPLSVESIGNYAFDGCALLKNVCYIGTEEQWDSIAIGLDNDRLLNAEINFNPSGTCGENLTWKFEQSTGTLTISGSGQMTRYSSSTVGLLPPWDSYRNSIVSLVIEDGVTSIGGDAFRFYTDLTNVTIPDSVTSIGFCSFYGCEGITDVYYSGSASQWNDISISNYNDSLLNATIYYNGIDPNKFTGIKGDYFYKNDVRQKAYQLVEFDGNFYYIADRHEIVKNKKVYLKDERINGLAYADGTPITAGYYNFDENGKMVILDGVVDNKVYKNNVQLKAYQLAEVDGEFYYIADRHEIVKNKKVYLKDERINGLTYADGTPITAGYYNFDENGKMVILDGIVDNKVYKNNVQLKAYQLAEVDGEFYYIADRHEIVKNSKVYIKDERINGLTYADGTPITAGYYEFDADGKMVILDGIVDNKVYKNNVQLKAYQLAEVDGEFYYIADRHEIVKNSKVYIKDERINGLTYADGTPITAGYYEFDADGKMIIQ